MTVSIEATIIKGAGVAGKNIKFQMPTLIWHFPPIKCIHTASINVLIDKPLLISDYDCTTLPIPWWDVDDTRKEFWHTERFSFLEIAFEYPIGRDPKRAWFYMGHDSSSFKDPRHQQFEIVSEKIEGLSYGQRCKINIEKSEGVRLAD